MQIDPARARYQDWKRRQSGYESFYMKAHHPREPLGFWIRYTIKKKRRRPPEGALWFTLFDLNGPVTAKVTTSDGIATGDGASISIGGSTFEPGRIVGAAPSQTANTAWALQVTGADEPLFHLPAEWMYQRSLPRTKPVSLAPSAIFEGKVHVGGRSIVVDGWRGMIGHNWGAKHGERWIWLHGVGFDGRDDRTWVDAVIGKIKLGPVTSPWVAGGAVSLGGTRMQLGGLPRLRATEVSERPDGCDVLLPGENGEVRVRVSAPKNRIVAWRYADPNGSEHHALNCSIADMTAEVTMGSRIESLTVTGGAAYELGTRDAGHGIDVQPYAD